MTSAKETVKIVYRTEKRVPILQNLNNVTKCLNDKDVQSNKLDLHKKFSVSPIYKALVSLNYVAL